MIKNKELTLVEQKSTILTSTDDVFSSRAGQGLENVEASDLAIPRITILQALSPQLNPKKPEFIKGAVVGSICDVGTGELFEEPLLYLPVYYVKQWIEWAPKGSAKTLVAVHPTAEIFDKCIKVGEMGHQTKDGNNVIETSQFFGLNLSAGNRRSFIPLSITQLKKSKRWLTLSTSEKVKKSDGMFYTPPLFYRTYELSTVPESNKKGDWAGWKIDRGERLQDFFPEGQWQEVLKEAETFRDSIKRGEVRGSMEANEEVEL